VPRCAGGVGLDPDYRVDAPHAEREDASTSTCPAGAPQRCAATKPPNPDARATPLGDEREALWPGTGVAQRRRGSRQTFCRTPGGRASPVRGAETLGGPPVGFGPIRNQQATTTQSNEAGDQGPFPNFWTLGQLGRAHWATLGPVALSAH
jgi:hypothetical protein